MTATNPVQLAAASFNFSAFLEAAVHTPKNDWRTMFRNAFLAAGRPDQILHITASELPAFVRMAVQAALTGRDGRMQLFIAANDSAAMMEAERDALAGFFARLPVLAASVVTHMTKFSFPKAVTKPFFVDPAQPSAFLSGASLPGRPVTFAGNATDIATRAFFEACALMDGQLINLSILLAHAHPAVLQTLRDLGASDAILEAARRALAHRPCRQLEEGVPQIIAALPDGYVTLTPVMSMSMASWLSGARAGSDTHYLPTRTFSVGGSNARNIAGYAMDMSGFQRVLASNVPFIARDAAMHLFARIYTPTRLIGRLPGQFAEFLTHDTTGWRHADRDRFHARHIDRAMSRIFRPLLDLRSLLEMGQVPDAHRIVIQASNAPELRYVRGDFATEVLDALAEQAFDRLVAPLRHELLVEISRTIRRLVGLWVEELA